MRRRHERSSSAYLPETVLQYRTRSTLQPDSSLIAFKNNADLLDKY